MARVTVLGGTGYVGSHVVGELAARGHTVTSYSTTAPAQPVAGVDYRTGSLLQEGVLAQALAGAEVVLSALAPRGDLAGQTQGLLARVAGATAGSGARFGVLGGAGSLLVAEGGPAVSETEGFPAEFQAEAAEMAAVLADLRAAPAELDWFYVSPAAGFGPWAPGEATGTFRLGGDVLLVDEAGNSNISVQDLAIATANEVDSPAHRRQRFTVAY